MRHFFHAYWKVIVALVLLIVLAVLMRLESASAKASLAERLCAHVDAVASSEHNTRTPEALEHAALYIEGALQHAGYRPSRQEYTAGVQRVRNIEASVRNVVPGQRPERIFILGAHYDSAQGAPGANDNGSGTAAVLELARLLKTMQPSAGTEVRHAGIVEPGARGAGGVSGLVRFSGARPGGTGAHDRGDAVGSHFYNRYTWGTFLLARAAPAGSTKRRLCTAWAREPTLQERGPAFTCLRPKTFLADRSGNAGRVPSGGSA